MSSLVEILRLAKKGYTDRCVSLFLGTCKFLDDNQSFLLLVLGISLLIFSTQPEAHAQLAGYRDNQFRQNCRNMLGLFEGQFGALLSASAGVGAIIASAMGGFKMAWALVVVSVGSFVLREYKDLFFSGTC